MSSVLAAQPSDIRSTLPFSRTKPTMSQVQEPTPPRNIKQEEDPERGRGRGRARSRSNERDEDGNDPDQAADIDGDGNNANSSNSDGPARKRRRSRKGLDKKFECPEEGCGKSYSRAEHL